ncbi:hypothetical protein ABID59_007391 [Bradyrhizobium sp. S3.3.6]
MVRCFLPPRLGLRVVPVQALEVLACGDGGGLATAPRPDLCFAGRYAPQLSRVAEGPSGRLGRQRHAPWPVAIGQRPLSCFNRTNDGRADTRATQRKTLGAWPKYNEKAARSPAEQGDGPQRKALTPIAPYKSFDPLQTRGAYCCDLSSSSRSRSSSDTKRSALSLSPRNAEHDALDDGSSLHQRAHLMKAADNQDLRAGL